MADLLLDTHACVFALAAPKRLGKDARRALQRAGASGDPVWIPAVVVAEVIILRELGRTDVGLLELEAAFAASTWRFLPIDLQQLDAFAAMAAMRDPFDRLIVAAARSVRAKLVTKVATIVELGLVDVVW